MKMTVSEVNVHACCPFFLCVVKNEILNGNKSTVMKQCVIHYFYLDKNRTLSKSALFDVSEYCLDDCFVEDI
jgi:hypothetical protein